MYFSEIGCAHFVRKSNRCVSIFKYVKLSYLDKKKSPIFNGYHLDITDRVPSF